MNSKAFANSVFNANEAWQPDTENEQPNNQKVNILVVDDLPEKHLVYNIILEELGQNIMIANSGKEALKLLMEHEFAVILLDVNMPEMDGFETANRIRKQAKSAHTPIIFLTAFNDETHMQQGYESGAVDYLLTPVVPEVLKAKVRVFIELSQMRQQAAMHAEEQARRKVMEEAARHKDEFLGMLGHELRNPLGPIRNAVHLMQMIVSNEPRIRELGNIIDRQVTHMTRLIDDLLDATRIASGKISLKKEQCDLTKIVFQTTEDYRVIFEDNDVKFNVHIAPGPIWVNGDGTRLIQAIGNLLHNAHKFTDTGGVVNVSLEKKKDYAEVKVSDNGIGIEKDMVGKIFEVFHQAEQGLDRNRGGLGLGLTLTKGLVELHEGEINVTSKGLGKGAEFIIRLPIILADANNLKTIKPIKVSEIGKKRRILIIEDNKDTAESTKLLLEMEGHEVMAAYGGTEGLKIAEDFLPNVILCDIGLPGIDGYQIAEAIKTNKNLAGTYIIALTGYGREEDQKKARDAGFHMHLTKPIDCANLNHILTDLPTEKA